MTTRPVTYAGRNLPGPAFVDDDGTGDDRVPESIESDDQPIESTDAGVCVCNAVEGCDQEGDPGCPYCRALDSEWPCPAEAAWDDEDGDCPICIMARRMIPVPRYAWRIDFDALADPQCPAPCNANAVGMTGPRNAPEQLLAQLAAGHGTLFRLADDDGDTCYIGRWVCTVPLDAATAQESFGPLDDFGDPNAGATSIAYLSGLDGTSPARWMTL